MKTTLPGENLYYSVQLNTVRAADAIVNYEMFSEHQFSHTIGKPLDYNVLLFHNIFTATVTTTKEK